MNEIQLKNRFLKYLNNNPKNNLLGLDYDGDFKFLEIKNEALNRKFDFILAVIKANKYSSKAVTANAIELDDNLKNLFTRGILFKHISEKYKVKIQNLVILPIEIKSNKDKLDDRLGNQIINAILSFGRSIVILDSNHTSFMNKNKMVKLFPSTLIGYDALVDNFVLLNKFNRIIADSLLNISKVDLIRALGISNMDKVNLTKLQKNLKCIQTINQKIIFNQVFSTDYFLLDEEIKFIQKFSSIDHKLSIKKEIMKSIKESRDCKITDFIT